LNAGETVRRTFRFAARCAQDRGIGKCSRPDQSDRKPQCDRDGRPQAHFATQFSAGRQEIEPVQRSFGTF
jgi:hypothetical protein